jgi:hypothetical protein
MLLFREERPEVCERRAEVFHLDPRVDLSGFEIAMAHQVRDVGEGYSGHPKVGAEGVTEGVNGRGPRGDSGPPADRLHLLQEVRFPAARASGDDPSLAPALAVLLGEDGAESFGEGEH